MTYYVAIAVIAAFLFGLVYTFIKMLTDED